MNILDRLSPLASTGLYGSFSAVAFAAVPSQVPARIKTQTESRPMTGSIRLA